MACILLTDMEPPTTTSPAAPHDDLHPLHPKEEKSAACLTVHLYHQVKDGSKGSEGALSFPAGQYVAEDLCVHAAKACGESQQEPSISGSSAWLLHLRLRPSHPNLQKCSNSFALFGMFCWEAEPE